MIPSLSFCYREASVRTLNDLEAKIDAEDSTCRLENS